MVDAGIGEVQTAMTEKWPGPLNSAKVLDFTRVLAGPFTTQILADLGADVIKIESVNEGDLTRAFPPFRNGESHYFVSINHDKKSMAIDLKKPEGLKIVKQLACHVADVVVENYRPGVMDRLGLSYETLSALNPKLIYCSISGFGLTGPLRDRPSFDVVTQAMTGAMSVNGELGGEATKIGLPIGDMVGGMFAPVAIASALYERERTGKGRMIDVSLFDGLIGMLGYLPQYSWFSSEDPKPVGSSHINIVPYGSFPTKDGAVVIACLSDAFWKKLCRCLDLEELLDDERYADMEGRKRNRDALEETLQARTRMFEKMELHALLEANDVPNAPVLSVKEALEHPHTKERDMVVTADHKTLGEMPLVGRPVKFPGSPQRDIVAPPTLGQHTAELLSELLDLSDAEIDQLIESGACGQKGAGQ